MNLKYSLKKLASETLGLGTTIVIISVVAMLIVPFVALAVKIIVKEFQFFYNLIL